MCLLSHTRVREPARKKHREKEKEREREPNRGERAWRDVHTGREKSGGPSARTARVRTYVRTYVCTEITYFQTESVSSMKPNERRTADGRQPRPSCQLIDRNTSINGPRARMHAIPFLGFFVFGTSRVSSRWPQVALVEKKPTVGDVVWKFWNCS